jgi:UDP-N-acetylglucosamine--N-acetylmuramyl-(pentapeptide) pyrophosphoryl-undecaprenol N-acetylglucosamine transferase
MAYSFVLTGGGSGGHVFPALAVARVLQARGHRLLFVGTREGMESKLVPEAGFDIEYVRSGALNRVGLLKKLQSAVQLPLGIAAARRFLKRFGAQGIFSTGGFASGPVMLAGAAAGVPLVVMEPNSTPGFANRKIGRRVYRALLGFQDAAKWFPSGRSEVVGLPVRPEFFDVRPKSSGPFTILITGGSQGSRTLNRASRESWKLLRDIKLIHQTGAREYDELAREFAGAGVQGEVVPFIKNMAETFAQVDMVIGRSGAGGVNEIAAAGMPSVLVPLPFAADDHQRKNAEALVAVGAARMILDGEMNGGRLYSEVEELRRSPETLATMRERVRQFAHPGAAERAAAVLEEAAESKHGPQK